MPHYGYNATATGNVNITSGKCSTSTIKNTKQTGNLKIHKQNEDNGKALSGFSFKISDASGNYIIAVDSSGVKKKVTGNIRLTNMQKTANPSEATEFTTDDNGDIGIYNMLTGTYRIIETSVGNNIYFEVDNNYISWSSNKGSGRGNTAVVEIGRQTSVNTGSTTNGNVNLVTIKNRQKYIDLSGMVWDDTPLEEGKETTKGNGIYRENEDDTADKIIDNVTVNLKQGDTILRTQDTKAGKAVLEEGESTYKFEKVEIDKLSEYYIEFVYNGMSYECVDLKGLTQWNTSKAVEGDARPTFNNKFKVITNNNANGDAGDISLKYDGITNHRSTLNYEITNTEKAYGYNGAEFPINYTASKYLINATTYNAYNGCLDKIKSPADIRKDGTTEIQNINLGVNEREQPDVSVKKDIKNVKILVNGKGQIYEYDKRFSHMNESGGDGYNVGVKFANKYGSMKYTRPIYKADVMFESADENRELQVYLTYVIGIKNNSSNLSAQINQIVDFYDKRYAENSYGAEIKVGTGLTDDATITNEIAFNDLGNNHNANRNEYNKMEIDTSSLGRIEKQSSKEIYVQFKLSRELVYEILGEEGTTQEPLDNVTEITSYSIFDQSGAVYAGIDQNSNPGNAVPGNKDTYEADTDAAPSLRLEYNEQRSISGNVFEDLPINELLNQNIRQGNGQLDNGEPGIPKVKVELLRKEARTNGTYGDWTLKPEYTTTTDENGSYTIKDFAAGDYVIRYTWGGKEHIEGVDKKYTAQSYKATIFDESKHNDPANKWYQETDPRYSDAKDTYDNEDREKLIPGSIEDTRETIDYDLNKDGIDFETAENTDKVMVSETPEMAVDVEYNPTEIYNPNAEENNRPSEGETEGQEDTYGLNRQHQIQNLDFGIIERPRQNYKLTKKVDHVKVTLSNGQVLVDAKIGDNYEIIPEETSSLTSMAPVAGSTQGYPNGLIKLEMDNEILHGSTLELTYHLSVENTSEKDYMDKAFYTYGTSRTPAESKAIKMKVLNITDYLDKEWAVDENEASYVDEGWNKIAKADLNGQVAQEVYQGRETKINDRIILQTEKLKDDEIATGETAGPVTLKTTKVLTTINDNDVELDNEAEIIKIYKTGGGLLKTKDPNKKLIPGNYVPGSGKQVEDDDDMAQTFTVSPNTGGNSNYVIIIALGAIALVGLGVGIVLIKKKVLE